MIKSWATILNWPKVKTVLQHTLRPFLQEGQPCSSHEESKELSVKSETLGSILALVLLETPTSLSLHVLIHKAGRAMPAAHCGEFLADKL